MELLNRTSGLMETAFRMRLPLEGREHFVSAETLDRFAVGEATRRERRMVVRHLLKGCKTCSQHLGQLVPDEPPQGPEGLDEAAFDRSLGRAYEVLSLRRAMEGRPTPATRLGSALRPGCGRAG